MPNLTVAIPAGQVTTKLGQIALAWWDAKHASDVPPTTRPTALVATQEMVRDYLRDVYRQAQVNDASATAQAAVEAARVQAVTDAGNIT